MVNEVVDNLLGVVAKYFHVTSTTHKYPPNKYIINIIQASIYS